MGVAVAIFALCVVLQLWSLCYMWCHSCGCCAMCGFVVVVVMPHKCHGHCLCAVCGVMVAIFTPHVVLQLWLLHCVWFHSCGCCATWVSQSQSLCHMWFCGCGCGHSCVVS